MEPFGLFNLLKSLAEAFPANAENTPAKKAENAPSEPPPAPKEAPNTPAVSEKQNACVDFLAMHEERAKRMKKR